MRCSQCGLLSKEKYPSTAFLHEYRIGLLSNLAFSILERCALLPVRWCLALPNNTFFLLAFPDFVVPCALVLVFDKSIQIVFIMGHSKNSDRVLCFPVRNLINLTIDQCFIDEKFMIAACLLAELNLQIVSLKPYIAVD